jgi:hypothetical protein
MKLRNPSRSPGTLLAHIPLMEKLSIVNQALKKPIGQAFRNPNQLLQQPSPNVPSAQRL